VCPKNRGLTEKEEDRERGLLPVGLWKRGRVSQETLPYKGKGLKGRIVESQKMEEENTTGISGGGGVGRETSKREQGWVRGRREGEKNPHPGEKRGVLPTRVAKKKKKGIRGVEGNIPRPLPGEVVWGQRVKLVDPPLGKGSTALKLDFLRTNTGQNTELRGRGVAQPPGKKKKVSNVRGTILRRFYRQAFFRSGKRE